MSEPTQDVLDTLPIEEPGGISPFEIAVHITEARLSRTTKARLRELVELFAATTIEYQKEAWALRKATEEAIRDE